MLAPHCPRCGHRLIGRSPQEPEAISPLEGTPSPPGEYRWGGWTWRYDYGRVAALLGKRPDAELAAAITAPIERLREFRRKLGVPPYHPLRGFEELIGKIPDSAVARRAGCAVQTVAAYRKRHGIPRLPRSKMHADRVLQAYLDDLDRLFERVT